MLSAAAAPAGAGRRSSCLSSRVLPLLSLSLLLLLLLPNPLQAANSLTPGLCEVETGQSSIIVDIEESRGSYIGQSTVPAELPIEGDPFSDISLDLVFPKGNPSFILNGKKLQLLEPLDRDADNLSHIVFQLTCLVKATKKKRTIPVIVRVSDVNDNAPVFLNTPYETTVSELTPVGTTIFQGIKAVDADAGVNGLAEYFIVEAPTGSSSASDGFGYFSINLPHQGQVTVNRSLDYERTQKYLLTIVASDRARNVSERFSSTTTLTVQVRDDDDQDPSFIYQGCMLHDGACINPEYHSSVSSGVLSGTLNILPEKIQAVDMDSISSPIRYSFIRGEPNSFQEYFEINPTSGAVRQVKAVDSGLSNKFELIIKAEEVSEGRRFTTAKLSIVVRAVDARPPVVSASATRGRLREGEPPGAPVLDAQGHPVILTVTDDDLGPEDPRPAYTFELTTDSFKVSPSGALLVNEDGLDRDPPSPDTYRFQVVAREVGVSGAASAPLSLQVELLDVNDNSPVLAALPRVTLPAGPPPQRVYQVEATDNDSGEFARITYSIYHVSNNGADKFTINPVSGLIETSGAVRPGEQYSISVEAADGGRPPRTAQGILEVIVAPGPNKRAPRFPQNSLELHVSEGATINSTVTTLTATDAENDPVTYSIVSGNDLRQFSIGSSSGIISVIRKLDREDLTRYQLLVKAEDPGRLSTTATVNIKVTDVNDKNPEFPESEVPYTFKIKEGLSGALVGRVHASDADEGVNALVSYSLPADPDLPFIIDRRSGEISTKTALDYETKNEYRFAVTAEDGAESPRLGTASVTVSVLDVPDEAPVFLKPQQLVTVPENAPDVHVATVQASDPDTVKQITYVIKSGAGDMFSIDRKSGEVRTVRGLDYEAQSEHKLIIGTEENNSDMPNSTTLLLVQVKDRNDLPPSFSSVPRPITLDDEAAIGTVVTTVIATDGDASAPNNQVRYQLAGRGAASKFFHLDPDTGVLRVRDDLRKETTSEYLVDIRAYDLGDPQLSSVSTVSVYVRHVATVPPETGLSFADTSYSEEVLESAAAGTLLKTIIIINQRAHGDGIPLKCAITAGDPQKLFHTKMTSERNCAVYLSAPRLDYENRTEYSLQVALDSLQGLVNPEGSLATLRLRVLDVNDNVPSFQFPVRSSVATAKGKYYAAVSRQAELATPVLQVTAVDADAGDYGKVEYGQSSWDASTREFFTLDSASGTLTTARSLESAPLERLPFVFSVTARDNPGASNNFHTTSATVIVDVLDESERMVLVFEDVRPEAVRPQADNIARIIEEKSDLVVGIEKFTARQFINKNGSLETDSKGTDVWFYTVDPETGKILPRNSTRVQRSLLEPAAQSQLTFSVSGAVRGTAGAVRAPLELPPPPAGPRRLPPSPAFPYALILIGCVIFVLGLAGIVYICASWNKYRNYKSHLSRQYGAPPQYSAVSVVGAGGGGGAASPPSEAASLSKEYETQVLNMAVPLDDGDSCNDLQLDFSANNHTFSLDNVSYITKHNGSHSPSSSDAATTLRASSVAASPAQYSRTLERRPPAPAPQHPPSCSTLPRRPDLLPPGLLDRPPHRKQDNRKQDNRKQDNRKQDNRKSAREGAIMAYDEIPGHNTIFQRSSDEEGIASSPSNDNVTFGKRDYSQLGFSYLNDRSPVETTTEL